MTKVDALSERVRELEMQSEAQQSHEALEKTQRGEELEIESESQDETHSSELEMQLQSAAQQKHEATETAEMLELRVADLERQLDEQSRVEDGADKQVLKQWLLGDVAHRLTLSTDIHTLFCR